MKWITIKNLHVNTNNLDAFWWKDGELYLLFNADPKSSRYEDPDRQLYLKLCRQQGIQPVMEETDG